MKDSVIRVSKLSTKFIARDFIDNSKEVETAKIFVASPPPSNEWRNLAANVISRCSRNEEIDPLFDFKVYVKEDPISVIECPEVSPHIRCSVVGDGNCLFRALSKAITGTEVNHLALQLAICNYMIHKDNVVDFMFLLGHYGKTSLQQAVDVVEKYLAHNKMRYNGQWGTEKEIQITSVMFQVDIFVYCEYGSSSRQWTLTHPAFVRDNGMIRSNVRLYIYHAFGHFDLVLPLTDSVSVVELCQCTCGSSSGSHAHMCPDNHRNW